jgi:hypothetical protein
VRRALFGFTLAVGLVATNAAAQVPEEVLPSAVRDEIRKLGPSARMVGEGDFDRERCGPLTDPGLVVADFDGDGRKDYAVLVRTGMIRPPQPGSRASGLEVEVALLVVLDAEGRWPPQIVQQFWLPPALAARYLITVQPPAVLVEFNGPGKVTLRQPGIMLMYCQAAATVYYWSPRKRRFDSIVVGG